MFTIANIKEKNELALQLLYRDIFGEPENQTFLKQSIDFDKGSWIKYLKTILFIDDDYLHDIRMKMNNNEKVAHLVTYLIKENRITLYKSFISVWKNFDLLKAAQFEKNIKNKINDQGLAEVDDEFQIVPYKGV